ncbi:MAG TPA: hypothetical protein PKI20_15125 [Verrucomicrobiota bacterium]|nr:hypothetical protein [Verrucomicrobiota bacterium]HQL79052.1 hypothetical protein [Verrucomicrobiota bacterium]
MASAVLCGTCVLAATSSWGIQFNLHADKFTKNFNGKPVEMWGFGLNNAPASVPGPTLTVGPNLLGVVDTTIVIWLTNNLDVPISLVIPGQAGFVRDAAHSTFVDSQGRTRARSFVKETQPGQVGRYEWTNASPGTFLYHSGSHAALQVQMGLYGALRRFAATGQAYPGTPYVSDVTWIFGELDLDVHEAVRTNAYDTVIKSMISSRAEVYLLNGEPYEVATLPVGAGTGNTLVRMLNACYDERVVVFNGQHVQVVAEDGRKYPYAKVENAVRLPALQTRDALLPRPSPAVKVFDRRYLAAR